MKAAYTLMITHETEAQNLRAQASRELEAFIDDGDSERIEQVRHVRIRADVSEAKALEAWRDLNGCHSAADLHTLQEGTPTCWWNKFL